MADVVVDAGRVADVESCGLGKLEGFLQLLGTSASLLVTSALLVVTMFAIRNKVTMGPQRSAFQKTK